MSYNRKSHSSYHEEFNDSEEGGDNIESEGKNSLPFGEMDIDHVYFEGLGSFLLDVEDMGDFTIWEKIKFFISSLLYRLFNK